MRRDAARSSAPLIWVVAAAAMSGAAPAPPMSGSAASPATIRAAASPPVSWMGYMEGLDSSTGACPVNSSGFYAAKHDPFVFFQDVAGSTLIEQTQEPGKKK